MSTSLWVDNTIKWLHTREQHTDQWGGDADRNKGDGWGWGQVLVHTALYYYYYYTQTHPFNGPLSGTTWMSRHQKSKTNLDFTGARDSVWQWHQLGHMQVCTSL